MQPDPVISEHVVQEKEKKHTPAWLVILLFLIFSPAALFIIFTQKYYHKWIPLTLWINAVFLLIVFAATAGFVLPQVRELSENFQLPPISSITDIILIFFMVLFVLQIIFGFFLRKKVKSAGHLSKKLLLVSLIFIVVNTVAPGFLLQNIVSPAYTLINAMQEPPMDTVTISPAPTDEIQESSSSAETGNQKKYTHKVYKFSFNYPSNMQLKENSQGFGVSQIQLMDTSSKTPEIPEIEILTFPKSLGKVIGQNFEEYYAMKNNTAKIIKDDRGTSAKITKVQNRTISNLRAFEYHSTSEPPKPQEEPAIGLYIEAGNGIVVISTDEKNKETLESILTTFKHPL